MYEMLSQNTVAALKSEQLVTADTVQLLLGGYETRDGLIAALSAGTIPLPFYLCCQPRWSLTDIIEAVARAEIAPSDSSTDEDFDEPFVEIEAPITVRKRRSRQPDRQPNDRGPDRAARRLQAL